MDTILVSAPDLSGEGHAAALVRQLRAQRPELRFVGLGGDRMRAAGVELAVERDALAVGGIAELLPELGRIAGAWRRMTRLLAETAPDLVVLVDAGGFNLPFAAHVRRHSRARILYFIAPQTWAWRTGRLRRLAAHTDRIVVCLPFERAHHARHGIAVEHFGHPLVDAWAEACRGFPPGESRVARRSRMRDRLGLAERATVIGLFPGSRRNEIARHLPLALEAFARLRARGGSFGDAVALVGLAPGTSAAWLRRVAGPQLARAGDRVRIVENRDGSLFDALDLALVKPGTVTLEAALHDCPMVVFARAHPVSAWLLARRLKIGSLALPNLIAEEPFVPELLQSEATPERIAEAAAALCTEPELARQRAGLARVVQALGPPGAIEATARLVEEMLASARA